MRTNFKTAALIALSTLSINAFACDIEGKTGFLPDNNRYIPVGMKAVGGITEVQFNRVMDKMINLYSSYVSTNFGKKFVVERKWTDGTVNAYAHQQTPGAYTIAMFGGLARHQEVTEDAMALVACHELGHHVGGAPKKTDALGKVQWATNEGQSDYWGAMKCLTRYLRDEDNTSVVSKMSIPQEVTNNCQLIYKNANEIAICQRVAMAGHAVGRLFNDLMGETTLVNFNTPDKNVVTSTYHAHPDSQCRLDTYYSAALCDKSFDIKVSNTDENQGVCSTRNGETTGVRPLCWFKPRD